jgi:Acetyl-CoA dehydrogenase C-terminal like/Acyl-CoA dehydrogenase, C-terminal domain
MGINASATCSLNFGEAGKCRGYLVGERCKGMKYMFQMMNEARLLCGVQGQALAAAAYENAVVYAKERVQGNNTSIINYPDIKRTLTMSRALSEGMRALLIKTAYHIDLSIVHPDDSVRKFNQNRADLLTPVCKAYCSDWGFRVTEMALQVLGGYGYTQEYPMEQYLRDVKIASIYEGANGIQALDLMGRKLSQNGGELFRELYEDISAFIDKESENAEFKSHIESLKKALDTVAQVAMKFAEWGMSGAQDKAMLGATWFLEMVGHVVIGRILLHQATIAQERLKEGSTDKFYRNKIRTAKFFASNFFPRVYMHAKTILGEDTSALEMEF